MNRGVIGILLAVACVAQLWIAAGRAWNAHAEAVRARAMYAALLAESADLVRLRASRPTVAAAKRPEPGIVGRVTDALARAGLPVSTLGNLTPDADSPVAGGEVGVALRRQSARLTLEPLALPELGKFLGSLRKEMPEWTCSSIQISPYRGGNAKGPRDARIRAFIVIEATYLDTKVPS